MYVCIAKLLVLYEYKNDTLDETICELDMQLHQAPSLFFVCRLLLERGFLREYE